jgi:PAS domain S-box-containing protein
VTGGTGAEPIIGWETLRGLFDRNPAGIQIVAPGGETIYANLACLTLLGRAGVERPLARFDPREGAAPELRAALDAALAGEPGEVRATPLPTATGEPVLVNVALTPLRDASGVPGGAILQYEALSGLDGLLLGVAESKARLDAALDAAREGILILDPAGRILLANPFAHDLYGVPRGHLAGRHTRDLAGMLRDRLADPAALPGDGDDPEEEQLIEFALARPQRRVLRQVGGPIYDQLGTFLGRVVFIHDITAEHAARRARDELLSVASHELRTPLTSIKGFAQLLRRELDGLGAAVPPRARRHLDAVMRQIDRLNRLVNELLDVSRIETGRLVLHPERCDLAALAAATAERLGAEAARRGHQLAVDRPREGVIGHWDPDLLDQVLANLLDNAMKFSPPGSAIRVTVAAREGWADLAVHDEGIGISPDQLTAIFEPFTHAGMATRRTYDGFGLGLYIARRLIERHGGQIWAESVEGQGSSFRVSLPR